MEYFLIFKINKTKCRSSMKRNVYFIKYIHTYFVDFHLKFYIGLAMHVVYVHVRVLKLVSPRYMSTSSFPPCFSSNFQYSFCFSDLYHIILLLRPRKSNKMPVGRSQSPFLTLLTTADNLLYSMPELQSSILIAHNAQTQNSTAHKMKGAMGGIQL